LNRYKTGLFLILLENFTFHDFKRPAGPGDLGSAHFWHNHLQFINPRNEDTGESGTFLSDDSRKFVDPS
jgi:hypothetical protein